MEVDSLVAGIVLLLIGILILIYGYSVVKEYQTSLGQIARALSREAQIEYEKGLLLMYVGALLGVTGFGLAIYGAVAEPKKGKPSATVPQHTVQAQPVVLEEMRYCPYCGALVKPDYQFCSMCGRKLK